MFRETHFPREVLIYNNIIVLLQLHLIVPDNDTDYHTKALKNQVRSLRVCLFVSALSSYLQSDT